MSIRLFVWLSGVFLRIVTETALAFGIQFAFAYVSVAIEFDVKWFILICQINEIFDFCYLEVRIFKWEGAGLMI